RRRIVSSRARPPSIPAAVEASMNAIASRTSSSRNLAQLLLAKRYWWVHFLVVAAISTVGVVWLGVATYREAPPLATFVSASGETVIPEWQINRGKEVFHLRGLMSYGSFLGDGAERGPDFTADALHRTADAMRAFYLAEARARGAALGRYDEDAIDARVRREIHANGWNERTGRIVLTDAQVHAYRALGEHYTRMFTDPSYPAAFHPAGYVSDPEDLQALTAFFFWGGWISGADRP